jgi:hypothetical protein
VRARVLAGETVLSMQGSPLGVFGGAAAELDLAAGEVSHINVRLESGKLVRQPEHMGRTAAHGGDRWTWCDRR